MGTGKDPDAMQRKKMGSGATPEPPAATKSVTGPSKSEHATPEHAPKPINPILDHALGAGIILLVARFVYWGAFETDDADALPMFAAAVAGCMVAIVATRSVAVIVGRVLSNFRSHSGIPEDCRDPLASDVAMKKWQDQSWQLAIHFWMSVWEIRLLVQNQEWWYEPTSIGCPGTYEVSFELKAFCLVQIALWMVTGVSCKWFEERRKDYVEMMVHHILTVGLILTAITNGEHAYVLTVVFVHDISDVVLDVMKMANYLKIEDSHGFFLTEIIFFLNTYVSWPYFRLYLLPFHVIHSTFTGYQAKCVGPDHVVTWDVTKVPLWITARSGFLMLLFGLHIFWFLLLNRIAMKLITATADGGRSASQAGDEEYEITMKDKEKVDSTTSQEEGKKVK